MAGFKIPSTGTGPKITVSKKVAVEEEEPLKVVPIKVKPKPVPVEEPVEEQVVVEEPVKVEKPKKTEKTKVEKPKVEKVEKPKAEPEVGSEEEPEVPAKPVKTKVAKPKAEKAEKAEKPAKTEKTEKTKAEVVETRRIKKAPVAPKKPKTEKTEKTEKAEPVKKSPVSFSDSLTKAFAGLTFLRANGESGFLKITGVPTYLARRGTNVYNGTLRLFGTPEEIKTFIAKEEVAKVYAERGIDVNDTTKVVSQDNLKELKENPESWFSKELAASKTTRKDKTVLPEGDSFHEQITKVAGSLHRNRGTKDTDRFLLMKNRIKDAYRLGKTIDVSGFKAENWTGAKQTEPPSKTSQTYVLLQSIPICAKIKDVENLKIFIKTLYADDEETMNQYLDEINV